MEVENTMVENTMNELSKAIKNKDESLYNRIRAKVAQSNRTDRRIEGVTEQKVESVIVKSLNELAKPKNR